MKEFLLNYYSKFHCLADKCNHTCCAGWEMNIDDKTLDLYKKEQSTFSSILMQGIDFDKSKFKTDASGRCAFLTENGLCEIIINLGESYLCQVCRDHPRFRSFFADRVETGLGFSCEEVAKMVLGFEEKIEPILVNDDGKKETLDFIEKSVVDFRQKAIEILQDRATPINDRIEKLFKICYADCSEKNLKKTLKTFISLERLDSSWEEMLKSIKSPFITNVDPKYTLFCEQFLVNSLYRHLSDAEDTVCARARTIACLFSWLIIANIVEKSAPTNDGIFEILVNAVRTWSAEVEYSQENLAKLFSTCYKFIKI